MRTVKPAGRAVRIAVAATLALAMTACSPSAEARTTKAAEAAPAEPQQVTMLTKDYFFVAPDTIEAGLTTIRLKNQGNEFHHIQLIELADGKTLDDLIEAMKGKPEGYVPSFATAI